VLELVVGAAVIAQVSIHPQSWLFAQKYHNSQTVTPASLQTAMKAFWAVLASLPHLELRVL
jgi:hypothetical protein